MKVATLFMVAITFIVAGCTSDPAAMHIAKGIDWDNRPIPADPKHLTILGPHGVAHFTVPLGWHIAQQPSSNGFSYTLARLGTFQPPYIIVELETKERAHLSQTELHTAHLDDIHTNFPAASRRPVGSIVLCDGRLLTLEEYMEGDVPELVAFQPEHGFATAFYLKSEEGTERHRGSFEELLRSYHVEAR